MSEEMIPLAEASADELRAYARINMGLEVHHNAGREKILAQMQTAGFEGEAIPRMGAAPAAAPTPPGAPAEAVQVTANGRTMTAAEVATLMRTGPRVEIMIPQNEGVDGRTRVQVQVNGYAISIQRGVKVAIPQAHFEALQNATQEVWDVDEDGRMAAEPRSIPRYSTQVFGFLPGPGKAA